MNSDRDGIRGGWDTPDDDQTDAESGIEMTGEFTIDYAPPAWYTQNASGGASGTPAAAPVPPPPATPATPPPPPVGQPFAVPDVPPGSGYQPAWTAPPTPVAPPVAPADPVAPPAAPVTLPSRPWCRARRTAVTSSAARPCGSPPRR
ncbi:SCO5717 family growth-regulating ATPase [Streptomyces diastatochromogenes]|nr:SCO5717 family growth-regulating ATPase [Streptomyces diastatochromogenes]